MRALRCCSISPSRAAGDASDRAQPCASFGLTVKQSRARSLVSEAAMEHRNHACKSAPCEPTCLFRDARRGERAERLSAVAAIELLLFSTGYSARAIPPKSAHLLWQEAILPGAAVVGGCSRAPNHGLTRCCLLQAFARGGALRRRGALCCLEIRTARVNSEDDRRRGWL